ncbi:hypothetical protein [Streptomyces violascens]|uniref:Uncharacterized protein n=1 Tax=Streptomyces violascens TaxID=67381 RepID=A0ABQ3QV93_9ACTN|nr:hypothetical protein [Streptomyces violascens]GGU44095.1 hypothetical protein GCM10010289_75950 [Streptomyces violascens]GHI41162.1 hypothetical protein Sviol_55700 [Streptomyces violascens]
MSTYLEPRRVRISTRPDEPAVIEIDGRDVASAVEAYRITQTQDEGPEVTLYVAESWQGVEFNGMAEVVAEPADLRHVVVNFLAAVDWQKLDEAVLDRNDLNGKPGELTRGVLAQLTEWAKSA